MAQHPNTMTTHVKVPEGLTDEQLYKLIAEQEADGWTFWDEKQGELIFHKTDPDEHEHHHDDMADMADMWRKKQQEDKA